jgi:hypothetical protein
MSREDASDYLANAHELLQIGRLAKVGRGAEFGSLGAVHGRVGRGENHYWNPPEFRALPDALENLLAGSLGEI